MVLCCLKSHDLPQETAERKPIELLEAKPVLEKPAVPSDPKELPTKDEKSDTHAEPEEEENEQQLDEDKPVMILEETEPVVVLEPIEITEEVVQAYTSAFTPEYEKPVEHPVFVPTPQEVEQQLEAFQKELSPYTSPMYETADAAAILAQAQVAEMNAAEAATFEEEVIVTEADVVVVEKEAEVEEAGDLEKPLSFEEKKAIFDNKPFEAPETNIKNEIAEAMSPAVDEVEEKAFLSAQDEASAGEGNGMPVYFNLPPMQFSFLSQPFTPRMQSTASLGATAPKSDLTKLPQFTGLNFPQVQLNNLAVIRTPSLSLTPMASLATPMMLETAKVTVVRCATSSDEENTPKEQEEVVVTDALEVDVADVEIVPADAAAAVEGAAEAAAGAEETIDDPVLDDEDFDEEPVEETKEVVEEEEK
eukprot:g16530.t1